MDSQVAVYHLLLKLQQRFVFYCLFYIWQSVDSKLLTCGQGLVSEKKETQSMPSFERNWWLLTNMENSGQLEDQPVSFPGLRTDIVYWGFRTTYRITLILVGYNDV